MTIATQSQDFDGDTTRGGSTPLQTPDYFYGDFDIKTPDSHHEAEGGASATVENTPSAPPKRTNQYADIMDDAEYEDMKIPYAKDTQAPAGKDFWVTRSKTIFSLPVEIRNRIYRYALFPKGIHKQAPSPYFSRHSTWKVKVPALLQTSYDVRKEALGAYYAQFNISCKDAMVAKMWLVSIGSEARMALGKVVVRWDESDTKRQSPERQRLLFYSYFRSAGVMVRKDAIEVY